MRTFFFTACSTLAISILASTALAADADGIVDVEVPAPVVEAPAPITLKRFTLTDGRSLVGAYDDASGQLTIHDEKTGKRMGQFAVAADTITKSEPVVIQPPDTANLPSGANGSWITNYEKAKELGAELKRPLLIDFTGSD